MSKLEKIQKLMKLHNLDYYWVEDKDPHFNEYVPEHWSRRSWVSGFDGSNGVLLIGLESAFLWTDGRYFVQAKKQLDESKLGIKMEKWIMPNKTPVSFLSEIAKKYKTNNKDFRLGYDAKSVSIDFINNLEKYFLAIGGELVCVCENLVDKIWDQNKRPGFPIDKISVYDDCFAGETSADKLNYIYNCMQEENIDSCIISKSDQIAWLLNLRGKDVKYTPVFLAYCILENINNKKLTKLFIDNNKVDENIKKYCEKNNIELCEYQSFFEYLNNNKNRLTKIWLDPKDISKEVLNNLLEQNIYYANNIIDKKKAVKNKIQQNGMRDAHLMDGAALLNGIVNIESVLKNKNLNINEYQAAQIINKSRLDNKNCLDLSFESISSAGENAAVIHYAPKESGSKLLLDENLYLLDSGGQYLSGTTDVTRVFCFNNKYENNEDIKKYYTLVLKGNLALSRVCFPKGTTGHQLDVLARQFLWNDGVDYLHGTGHGVGSYLSVHEGPHGISPRGNNIALEPGMVVSNEPGVYFEGKFGIRIEDLLLVKKHDKFDDFLCFEKLTMFPYEKKLINNKLLSQQDYDDIRDYNLAVYNKLIDYKISKECEIWLKARLF